VTQRRQNSVKVFGQSTLGSEKDTIEQTKIGALDMVRVNVAPFNNIVPATIVPSLPFLFKSKEHMRRVLDGPIGDEILAAMEAQGFIGLAFYDSGSRSFRQEAIKSPTPGMRSASNSRTCGSP
jgi:TRAP-type C4-dicarboxylate transport system substrate-binding protein